MPGGYPPEVMQQMYWQEMERRRRHHYAMLQQQERKRREQGECVCLVRGKYMIGRGEGGECVLEMENNDLCLALFLIARCSSRWKQRREETLQYN